MIFIVGVVVGCIGYRLYQLFKRKSPLEDYMLCDLMPGDRIMATFGSSDCVFVVIKNYPHLKKVVVRHKYSQREVRPYHDYSFNNFKCLDS